MERITQLSKMLDADPSDTFVLYSLGQEHAKAGRHDEAIGFYERCIGADAGEHYAYFHMARSLEAMGEDERAAEALRTGLARATADDNQKAAGEIEAYLSQLA